MFDLSDVVFTVSFIVTDAAVVFCMLHFLKASLLVSIILSPIIAILPAFALAIGLFFVLNLLLDFKRRK